MNIPFFKKKKEETEIKIAEAQKERELLFEKCQKIYSYCEKLRQKKYIELIKTVGIEDVEQIYKEQSRWMWPESVPTMHFYIFLLSEILDRLSKLENLINRDYKCDKCNQESGD